MSSQKVEVSSIQEYSENAQKVEKEKNTDMLHPNWSYFQREPKIKAKSTCGLSSKKGSQEDQVFYYKQKAHQSFMQVIQVQQLHQQEIQQVKQEYEQKIKNLEDEIKQKKSVIEVLEKNSTRHLIEFKKSLEIDDIGLIQCREPNLSRFDDSTLLTFKQFLTEKESDAKVISMREEFFNFITYELKKYLQNPQQPIKNIKKEVNSIFQYVKQVRHQLLTKMQSYEALLKKYEQIDANHKKLKTQYELVQKDALRMSQNLKQLKNEKNSLEKKNFDLQKKLNLIGKQMRSQMNTKQNYLKTSLNDLQKGATYSRKTIESQKQIIKNQPETLKISKTKFDPKANKSDVNLQTKNTEKLFMSTAKFQYLPKEDDSFDVHDLIAEMNVDTQRFSMNPDRNQKRTQLMVSQPLGNKIRRKSFDN